MERKGISTKDLAAIRKCAYETVFPDPCEGPIMESKNYYFAKRINGSRSIFACKKHAEEIQAVSPWNGTNFKLVKGAKNERF